jgi:cytochrome P450
MLGEDCFTHANEFIPDRWTTRPELVKNVAAYNPWGTGMCNASVQHLNLVLKAFRAGHHSCIARVMATDMLRATTARIIKNYQFKLAPGETGRRVLQDMKDQSAPNPGRLELCFAPRQC